MNLNRSRTLPFAPSQKQFKLNRTVKVSIKPLDGLKFAVIPISDFEEKRV
jgi:hypothetical protein